MQKPMSLKYESASDAGATGGGHATIAAGAHGVRPRRSAPPPHRSGALNPELLFFITLEPRVE